MKRMQLCHWVDYKIQQNNGLSLYMTAIIAYFGMKGDKDQTMVNLEQWLWTVDKKWKYISQSATLILPLTY